jgi:maleate cis-trans isomerase
MPAEITMIPTFLNVHEQVASEFQAAFEQTEARVRELAEQHVDLVHPIGAPLFMLQVMLQGFAGEQKIVAGWQERYGVPIVTSPQTQVEALRALGMRRFVGLTYIRGEILGTFAAYLADAGFDVLAMECLPGSFRAASDIAWTDVHAYAKELFHRHAGAEGVYLLGSGWQVQDAVVKLEQDLGVPVAHPVPARVWAIQRRLQVRHPIPGYGRLLETLP